MAQIDDVIYSCPDLSDLVLGVRKTREKILLCDVLHVGQRALATQAAGTPW